MKLIVTGANGQLAFDVLKKARARGIETVPAGRKNFNITDAQAVGDFFNEIAPDAVVHCAAYTDVESAQGDPLQCFAVNRDGTANIAAACERVGAKLIYISSDYVFGDDIDAPHPTDGATNPLNVYGRAKLAGEREAQSLCSRCFVVRTSWVFGSHGRNFVSTILRLSATQESIRVVNDQIGSPTYSADLAELLCDMLATEKYGVYHATNEGFCTWAQLASEIMRLTGRVGVSIVPVSSSEYGSKVCRPHNSRLSKDCLDAAGFRRLPPWQDALSRFLTEVSLGIK